MPTNVSRYEYLGNSLKNIPAGDACLEWPYGLTNIGFGYGTVRVPGVRPRRNDLVHRVAYEICFGAIPTDLRVCHHCDNPKCYRPSHLFLGTVRENAQDMMRKGRGKWPHRIGEQILTAKLSERDVLEIRELYLAGMKQRELARRFSMHYMSIHYIVKGKNWKHL